ncbi:HAMP domain-containing sensor histidine kinase [uncultured Ruegeria sp.]|uniref:sensor histidine kinase n=1 Tax=uncultured Ruegeria sp. TaxID=259304 RepID=UPI002604BCE2|nr:HAMP domain-containing sensor histidine kinase [uncultured Ruegeria sp.]
MLSLRQRALLGGIASGALSVGVGTLVVFSYINTRVLEQFDGALQDRHTQLVVGLSATTDDPETLRQLVFDPAYSTPYSGRYWQVTDTTGAIYTSASLFDEKIAEPPLASGETTIWNTIGPDREAIRSVYQKITFEDGTEWGVTVAESRSELINERSAAQRNLLPVFGLVGLIGVASSLLLMSAIVGPLRKLRADVARRWDQGDDLVSEDYPDEVSPLVEDLNKLLHRNREIVTGSRRQAADLAHALKTPTAILRNELADLSDAGAHTEPAEDALTRIDAQLGRSLARMRASNTGELTHPKTDLSNSVERLSRLFSVMAEREGKTLVSDCETGLRVRMDPQDIEEVIGNLLDNALKWSRTTFQVTARRTDRGIEICVEDDGPGVPEDQRLEILRSGNRLDTSVQGTGLGLSISVDLLNAYGGKLELGTSESLGGLTCEVRIGM